MKDSTFRIKIIEGKELVCEDANGLADAYVILKFYGEEHRSQMIKDTATPVWNEEYSWKVEKPGEIEL